jgi:hypothetical protein
MSKRFICEFSSQSLARFECAVKSFSHPRVTLMIEESKGHNDHALYANAKNWPEDLTGFWRALDQQPATVQ